MTKIELSDCNKHLEAHKLYDKRSFEAGYEQGKLAGKKEQIEYLESLLKDNEYVLSVVDGVEDRKHAEGWIVGMLRIIERLKSQLKTRVRNDDDAQISS